MRHVNYAHQAVSDSQTQRSAINQGAKLLLSGGAPSSNFAGALALAARSLGLACELHIAGAPGYADTVPLQIARRSGADIRFSERDRGALDMVIQERGRQLEREGRAPYVMPRGGATAVGSLGFAQAAYELRAQLDDTSINEKELSVVIPTGSGASLAGFLAGSAAINARWKIVGVSVSRPIDVMRKEILDLARHCAGLIGAVAPLETSFTLVDFSSSHDSALDLQDRESALLALHSEGLLFDQLYGVKSFRTACEIAERSEGAPVLLWHTGGIPGALKLLGSTGWAP